MTTCISASRKLDRARKFRFVQARGICGAIRVRLVEAPFHLLRGARNLPLPLTVERTLLEQRQEKPLHDDNAMQPFAQPDHDTEDRGPEQIRVRQRQRERQDAENRAPDHVLPADPVAHRPANESPRGHSAQKHEQVDLRGSHCTWNRLIRKKV
jgi:hypothetical protein